MDEEIYEIPAYTTYEISELLRKKMVNVDNVEQYCKKRVINKELLDIMLQETKIFSVEMYEIASKILNITFNELTAAKNTSVQTKFRKKIKCSVIEVQQELDIADLLFNEIIINAKLNSGSEKNVSRY